MCFVLERTRNMWAVCVVCALSVCGIARSIPEGLMAGLRLSPDEFSLERNNTLEAILKGACLGLLANRSGVRMLEKPSCSVFRAV